MKLAIIILFSIILIFPVYMMVLGSAQPLEGIMKVPPTVLPRHLTLENYKLLIVSRPLLLWLGNTVFVVVFSTIISLVVSTTAGYAFSRYRFKLRKALFWMFMASIMIPGQVMFVPKFVLIRRLGLSGLRWSVILPHVFSAVHIYLFKNYVDAIPTGLFDTAVLEGANPLQMLWQVVVPICKPIVGALALFLALGAMGDYMWQYLMLREESQQTLLIGIMTTVLREESVSVGRNPIGLSLAGSTLLFLPMFALFAFFQKYFQRGVMRGAVKE